jgi:short subunit dehydrogenase-like uncharacterized protein
MANTLREFDIVVLGAYAYTAAIVCECITKNLPTNLKWAISGRSEKKLEELALKLKGLNANREPPSEYIWLSLHSPAPKS